jgi:hypothetical protein
LSRIPLNRAQHEFLGRQAGGYPVGVCLPSRQEDARRQFTEASQCEVSGTPPPKSP